MQREGVRAGQEQMREIANVRHVTDQHQVARFCEESVPDELGRIVRRKASHHPEFRERIAQAIERFSGLPSAKFPAMPDCCRDDAGRFRPLRQPFGLASAASRQRPSRVDPRADGVGMMDENKDHSRLG